MLNLNQINIQARDKKRENIQWIMQNTTLKQAMCKADLQEEESQSGNLANMLELLKSFFLLKRPAQGHK